MYITLKVTDRSHCFKDKKKLPESLISSGLYGFCPLPFALSTLHTLPEQSQHHVL